MVPEPRTQLHRMLQVRPRLVQVVQGQFQGAELVGEQGLGSSSRSRRSGASPSAGVVGWRAAGCDAAFWREMRSSLPPTSVRISMRKLPYRMLFMSLPPPDASRLMTVRASPAERTERPDQIKRSIAPHRSDPRHTNVVAVGHTTRWSQGRWSADGRPPGQPSGRVVSDRPAGQIRWVPIAWDEGSSPARPGSGVGGVGGLGRCQLVLGEPQVVLQGAPVRLDVADLGPALHLLLGPAGPAVHPAPSSKPRKRTIRAMMCRRSGNGPPVWR